MLPNSMEESNNDLRHVFHASSTTTRSSTTTLTGTRNASPTSSASSLATTLTYPYPLKERRFLEEIDEPDQHALLPPEKGVLPVDIPRHDQPSLRSKRQHISGEAAQRAQPLFSSKKSHFLEGIDQPSLHMLPLEKRPLIKVTQPDKPVSSSKKRRFVEDVSPSENPTSLSKKRAFDETAMDQHDTSTGTKASKKCRLAVPTVEHVEYLGGDGSAAANDDADSNKKTPRFAFSFKGHKFICGHRESSSDMTQIMAKYVAGTYYDVLCQKCQLGSGSCVEQLLDAIKAVDSRHAWPYTEHYGFSLEVLPLTKPNVKAAKLTEAKGDKSLGLLRRILDIIMDGKWKVENGYAERWPLLMRKWSELVLKFVNPFEFKEVLLKLHHEALVDYGCTMAKELLRWLAEAVVMEDVMPTDSMESLFMKCDASISERREYLKEMVVTVQDVYQLHAKVWAFVNKPYWARRHWSRSQWAGVSWLLNLMEE